MEKWPSTLEDFSEQLKAKIKLHEEMNALAEEQKQKAKESVQKNSSKFIEGIKPYFDEYVKLTNEDGLYVSVDTKSYNFEISYSAASNDINVDVSSSEGRVLHVYKSKNKQVVVNQIVSHPMTAAYLEDIAYIFEGDWLKGEVIKNLLGKIS